MNTRDIEIFLKGVRADFADVVDQAQKQLAAYESNVYMDATVKTGALFNEETVQGRQRVEVTSTTGVSRLLPREERQAFQETAYVPSFVTSVEPYEFARRITVSRESVNRRDAKYMRALDEASKLQVAYANTKANHRFDVFNKSFALYTDMHLYNYNDTVATCSASHPDKIGGTHSNLVTASDVNDTAVNAMCLVLQNQVDDIGEPMPMGGGMKYWVGPNSKTKKFKELTQSEWQAENANNAINVWKTTGWYAVSSPYLNSTYGGNTTAAWWIVDGMFSPIKEYVFKPVAYETWFDNDKKVAVHDISFEHKVGVVDYRGIVGNVGL